MNWVSIGAGNGLSPVQRQAIIWTTAEILLIQPLTSHLIEIYIFSFKKTHLKLSSSNWWQFCPDLNVLAVRRHTLQLEGHNRSSTLWLQWWVRSLKPGLAHPRLQSRLDSLPAQAIHMMLLGHTPNITKLNNFICICICIYIITYCLLLALFHVSNSALLLSSTTVVFFSIEVFYLYWLRLYYCKCMFKHGFNWCESARRYCDQIRLHVDSNRQN